MSRMASPKEIEIMDKASQLAREQILACYNQGRSKAERMEALNVLSGSAFCIIVTNMVNKMANTKDPLITLENALKDFTDYLRDDVIVHYNSFLEGNGNIYDLDRGGPAIKTHESVQ